MQCLRRPPHVQGCLARRGQRCLRCRAAQDTDKASPSGSAQDDSSAEEEARQAAAEAAKKADKNVKSIAGTFAPRPSGNTGKNPAVKGSVLYTVFDVQAWLGLAIGGLLSFNLIFPSDRPDIARLMGMWSVWMFTIPSLRARECTQPEKDWLNYSFVLVPLINVILPFAWKNFAFVYSADCVALLGIYLWKVGGLTQDKADAA